MPALSRGAAMPLKTYQELDVWQKAMDLVEQIYGLSGGFPGEEKFGLVSQIRRAAVSVPANIAEGYGRKHRAEYLHHLSMARGSLYEVETHLAIAVRLDFIAAEQVVAANDLITDVSKMLYRMIESLQHE
jgi:four helix bundle protein